MIIIIIIVTFLVCMIDAIIPIALINSIAIA
mgnify:CR=1 FL=1